MEINKIVFENLKELTTDKTFDELDVNNDGVINDQDLSETKNAGLKEQIQKALDYVDSEGEVLSEDENFQATLAKLDEIQENIAKKKEEMETLQKLIDKKEKQKEEIENKQKEVEDEIKELQDSLCIADSDEAKRSIQKQIITKEMENLSFLNQIKQLKRTISSKTSSLESLTKDVETLEKQEAEMTTKLENNKISAEKAAKKANLPTNQYGLTGLNSQNFDEAFEGAKGVQYVVLSLPTCGRCHNLMKQLASELSEEELQSVAAYDLYDLKDSQKYMDALASSVGGSIWGGYPKLLKLVDGKPVEVINYSNVSNMKKMIINDVKNND